jgi:hypothetical protein
MVKHQRVLGSREAAATTFLVSMGSRRPHVPAWDGVVDQPSSVPIGTIKLMTAGNGAGLRGLPAGAGDAGVSAGGASSGSGSGSGLAWWG